MSVQAGSSETVLMAALPTDPRERARLALEIGVDQSTMWRWKTGKSRPTSEAMWHRLAEVLELPLERLRDGGETDPEPQIAA